MSDTKYCVTCKDEFPGEMQECPEGHTLSYADHEAPVGPEPANPAAEEATEGEVNDVAVDALKKGKKAEKGAQ